VWGGGGGGVGRPGVEVGGEVGHAAILLWQSIGLVSG
jgi:hypothetical protein